MKVCTKYNDQCCINLIAINDNVVITKAFKSGKYLEIVEIDDENVNEFLQEYVNSNLNEIYEEKWQIIKDGQVLRPILHRTDGPALIEYYEEGCINYNIYGAIRKRFYYMGKEIANIYTLNTNNFYYIENDSFNKKNNFKKDGCIWDPDNKMWYTADEKIAKKHGFVKINMDINKIDAYMVAEKLSNVKRWL